jgi:hypothetical protein
MTNTIKQLEEFMENLPSITEIEDFFERIKMAKELTNLKIQQEKLHKLEQARKEKQPADESNGVPAIRTVFDIILLEDILQKAKERFKDDLWQIEQHQVSIERIQYVRDILEDHISKTQDYKKPSYPHSKEYWSSKPLPDDKANSQIFLQKLNEEQNTKSSP